MDAGMATDEVTDLIALIEMNRQETQKEAGLAAACSEALRKLHEQLDREQAELHLQGSGNGHPANIEALTNEIQRVRRLASVTKPGSSSRHSRPQQQRRAQPGGPRNPDRNRARRTMSRRGGR